MTNDQLAWLEFLDRFEWDHMVTLTTRFPYQHAALDAEFQRRFIRRLAQMAQQRVGWFYACENNGSGYPHLHVLLTGSHYLPTKHIERAWTAGFTRVTVITREASESERRRDALRYVTKRIIGTLHDFDLSRQLYLRGHRGDARTKTQILLRNKN